jgi:hypothetical protein
MVTEANVRALDLANGGGYSRNLAGTPPAFRPVGNYEAGRAPMFARGFGGGGGDGLSPLSPRGGGLFSRFFGR